MKKYLVKIISVLVVFGFLISTNLQAQSFFENSERGQEASDPGGHGTDEDPPENPAPIDDYLPILFVASIAIAVKYRKRILTKV